MRLKVVLRDITWHMLDPYVSIVSLTTGMVCINLIGVSITRELNTDGFHRNKNRIFPFRMVTFIP